MSFSIHLNPNKALLYVHGTNDITAEDLSSYFDEMQCMPGVKDCTKALIHFDGDDVNFKQLTLPQVKELAYKFNQSPVLPIGCKMAIVVRSKLAFGLVKMFMGLRHKRLQICPFLDMSSALTWLELNENDLPDDAQNNTEFLVF